MGNLLCFPELTEHILRQSSSSVRARVCSVSHAAHKQAINVSKSLSVRPALYDLSVQEAREVLLWRKQLRTMVCTDVHLLQRLKFKFSRFALCNAIRMKAHADDVDVLVRLWVNKMSNIGEQELDYKSHDTISYAVLICASFIGHVELFNKTKEILIAQANKSLAYYGGSVQAETLLSKIDIIGSASMHEEIRSLVNVVEHPMISIVHDMCAGNFDSALCAFAEHYEESMQGDMQARFPVCHAQRPQDNILVIYAYINLLSLRFPEEIKSFLVKCIELTADSYQSDITGLAWRDVINGDNAYLHLLSQSITSTVPLAALIKLGDLELAKQSRVTDLQGIRNVREIMNPPTTDDDSEIARQEYIDEMSNEIECTAIETETVPPSMQDYEFVSAARVQITHEESRRMLARRTLPYMTLITENTGLFLVTLVNEGIVPKDIAVALSCMSYRPDLCSALNHEQSGPQMCLHCAQMKNKENNINHSLVRAVNANQLGVVEHFSQTGRLITADKTSRDRTVRVRKHRVHYDSLERSEDSDEDHNDNPSLCMTLALKAVRRKRFNVARFLVSPKEDVTNRILQEMKCSNKSDTLRWLSSHCTFDRDRISAECQAQREEITRKEMIVLNGESQHEHHL